MKRFRMPLLAAAVFVALLLVGLGVLFSSTFQTWAARRALASRPDLRGTIGHVSAGLGRVEVRDVRLERDGAVLILPVAEIELPVIAAGFRDKVLVTQLSAKGWTLDLSQWRPAAMPGAQPVRVGAVNGGAATPPTVAAATPPPANPAPAADGKSSGAVAAKPAPAGQAPARPVFDGIFDHLKLPFDLALDGVEVNGQIIMPESRGRAQVTFAGGGVAVGKSGQLAFRVEAALNDTKISAAGLRGSIALEMDTPRSIRRIGLTADATATGTQFPNGIRLAAAAGATRGAERESYSIEVNSEGRQVLAVQAELPRQAPLLTGTWKANIRHSDLAPFALGRPLPEFTLAGDGRFDTDAAFVAFHAAGRASGTANELRVLVPQLSAVGAIKLAADFDVGRRGDAISIRKLEADLAGDTPIARLQALQAFEFNPTTAELRAENAERDLFDVVLHGVPVAWAKPFSPDPQLVVGGGEVKGELVAIMRAGGTTLRTKTPLTVGGVSVAQAGRALVEGLGLSVAGSADYTPHGWQAEVSDLTIRRADTTLIAMNARAGRLPGNDQPVKATGRLTADLPSVFAQPVTAGMVTLTQGEAVIDFAASLGATKGIQAKLALTKLVAPVSPAAAGENAGTAAPPAPKPEALPTIRADLRADLAADGHLTFNAPITIEHQARKSDLTVAGTLKPGKDINTVEAQATSDHLVVDDAKILAALLPADSEKTAEKRRPDAKPPWAGYRGSLTLRLKKVVYSDSFVASEVGGTLRLDADGVKIDGLRMGLGEGDARLDGLVSFRPAQPQPYGLDANLAMRDFDPGPLLRAVNPGQPPTVEGKFTVQSDVRAKAGTLEQLATEATGDFEVTSRGGVFRGLPVNVGNVVENSSKLAAWLASAGSALGALTGKKDYSDVASKAQAVAELAKGLNPLPFDQLSVMLSRDAARNTTLKDFTLISPEIRLTGGGRMTHAEGRAAILDDSLAMEFQLRARGRQGDLLKYLGMIEPQVDNLGYAACTLPLKVGGTLRAPDTSELNQRLVALALEKSGVGEKANELLQKFRMVKPSGED